MSNDRTEIHKIFNDMFDGVDESGIYPTSTAFSRLELYVMQQRFECLGWMVAYACVARDEGKDIRLMEVPDIVSAMVRDLKLEVK